jgi:hypothetical protein
MSDLTRKDLANLKKLIKNVEELIKLNVDFKNRLERNSRRDLNITNSLLKKAKANAKEKEKSKRKSLRKKRTRKIKRV